MVKRLKEAIDDTEWEAFILRCQENPVYKEIKELCKMYGYKCAEVIYWSSPSWLTFGLEPEDNRLPIILYDSHGMSKWLLSVLGCSLLSNRDVITYSNGISNAKELFKHLQELPLENLERGY